MSEEYLTAEMIEILRQIHAEQKKTNARLETIEDELSGFRRETREELVLVQSGQKDMLTELRGLRGEVGTEVIKLKERVEKLEAAVFPKAPRPTRRAAARR